MPKIVISDNSKIYRDEIHIGRLSNICSYKDEIFSERNNVIFNDDSCVTVGSSVKLSYMDLKIIINSLEFININVIDTIISYIENNKNKTEYFAVSLQNIYAVENYEKEILNLLKKASIVNDSCTQIDMINKHYFIFFTDKKSMAKLKLIDSDYFVFVCFDDPNIIKSFNFLIECGGIK